MTPKGLESVRELPRITATSQAICPWTCNSNQPDGPCETFPLRTAELVRKILAFCISLPHVSL